MTGGRLDNPTALSDGSDSTTYNLYGRTAYSIGPNDLIPQAYVDRLYVRSASASGTVKVDLKFIDNTTETVTFPAFTATKTDYYADVQTKSKIVKSFYVYGGAGDFNISEFDMRQGDYNPSDPSAFVINNLSVKGDYRSATLEWSEINPEYFGQYNIYKNGVLVTTIKENGTHNYTITGLDQLTDYTFSVSASDQFKKEYGKATSVYKTAQRPPPPKPSINVTGDDKTATLRFFSNSDYIKKYTVFQNGIKLADVVGNNYNVTGLENGTEYSYYVVAVDDQEASSAPSDTVKVIPSVRKVPQPILTASATSGAAKLTITADSPYIRKYLLYQDGQQIADIVGNTYTVNGLINGKAYSFYGIAVDDRGTSSPASQTVRVTPKAPTTDSGQERTDEYLLVKWDATEGATGYVIYLNNRKIASVSKEIRQYKISTAEGYNPRLTINESKVIATFADGSTSTPNPGGIGGGGSGDGGGSGNGSGGGSDNGGSSSGTDSGFSNVRNNMPFSVVNTIKAALEFLAIYKEFALMAAAIIFAPFLVYFVYWLLEQTKKEKKLRRG